jgi:hypothetical protein
MRVLRTEFYADDYYHFPLLLPPRPEPTYGVSVAWISVPRELEEADIRALIEARDFNLRSGQLRNFLGLALSGREDEFFDHDRNSVRDNDPEPNQILYGNIIIEQSPPEAVPLSLLLSKASTTVIGTYIGFQLAGDNPVLLLATVPLGLIVIGSAMGVSKAFEKGLTKAISRLIEKKLK